MKIRTLRGKKFYNIAQGYLLCEAFPFKASIVCLVVHEKKVLKRTEKSVFLKLILTYSYITLPQRNKNLSNLFILQLT